MLKPTPSAASCFRLGYACLASSTACYCRHACCKQQVPCRHKTCVRYLDRALRPKKEVIWPLSTALQACVARLKSLNILPAWRPQALAASCTAGNIVDLSGLHKHLHHQLSCCAAALLAWYLLGLSASKLAHVFCLVNTLAYHQEAARPL